MKTLGRGNTFKLFMVVSILLFVTAGSASAFNLIQPYTGPVKLKFTNWEEEDPQGPGNKNRIIDQQGEVLRGIAKITSIQADNLSNTMLWYDGKDGEELTIEFGGYVAKNITTITTGNAIEFTDGWMNVYLGTSLNFNATYPGSGVTDGTLFLSLKGIPGIVANDSTITLRSTLDNLTTPFSGKGAGYIQATGGSHASLFGGVGAVFQLNSNVLSPDPGNSGWPIISEDPIRGTIVGETPCVKIIKKTNGADANNPNGADVPMISVGGQVTWDYEVTNCGNVPVAKADVVVTDSQTGVTPAFASVISGNGDNVFDPGEVWLYKATGIALDLLQPQGGVATVPNVCAHNGQLPPRTAYVNTGTVTIPGATASDPSSYCNPPSPCVTIIKYTNGADANNPDGTDVPNIGTGLSVNWTYKVTNCGNVSVAMADVHVTDNQGVIPVYVSGDVNINGLFDPGEVWAYQATGVALDLLTPAPGVIVQPGVCTHGQTEPPRTAYINLGTVNIPDASASDPSSYCNPPGPCVTLIKKTNGADANDPNGAGVPIIKVGDPVTWTYEIKNCGNVTVSKANVVLTDNQPGVTPSYTSGDVNNNGLFDPDEVWLYTATGFALDLLTPPAGVQVKQNVCTQGGTVQPPQTAYVNLGTVTIPGASATDPSSYCNPPPIPCVKIVKYTNGIDANDPDAADVPVVSVGDPVTWTYKVSNCGEVSVPMGQVVVTDNQPGVTPVFDSVLSGNADSFFDSGEVWLYKATGPALDLSTFHLGVTTVPNVCTHNSTQPKRTAYFNTGTVTIPGSTASDPSSYCNPQELFGGCRMTGGNVTVDNAIVSNVWSVTNSSVKTPKNAAQLYTSYTVGGQIGAPRAGCTNTPDTAFGEWTHTQHSGAEGSFTFHAGTNSAPDDAYIKCITCADPGWCVHALCAPFKQIFWEGTGVFKNEKGFSAKFNNCTVNTFSNKDKTYSLHYYKAHVGDFGEPGNTGKQKSFDPSVCKWRSGGVDVSNAVMMTAVPDDKFGDKGGQTCEACPDWYEIEIHCTAEPSSPVIYRGAGFITGGNYQIHPEVGEKCPF